MNTKILVFITVLFDTALLQETNQFKNMIPKSLVDGTDTKKIDISGNSRVLSQIPDISQTDSMPINNKGPTIDNKSFVINPNALDNIQDTLSHQTENRKLDDGMNRVPPLTMLPPRIVDSEQEAQSLGSIDPTKKNPRNQPKYHKKQRRGLNVHPYMNIGNGYLDIAQSGLSPLGMAMSNPHLPSMSPFLPRMTPPPPIRIQIHDPESEKGRSNVLSESNRAVYKVRINNIAMAIEKEIVAYQSDIEAQTKKFDEKVGSIKKLIEDIRRCREESKRKAKTELPVKN